MSEPRIWSPAELAEKLIGIAKTIRGANLTRPDLRELQADAIDFFDLVLWIVSSSSAESKEGDQECGPTREARDREEFDAWADRHNPTKGLGLRDSPARLRHWRTWQSARAKR